MQKPAFYLDKDLGNRRADFEAKSSRIRDQFKTQKLFIPAEEVENFLQFLKRRNNNNTNPYLLEKIQKITGDVVLAQAPIDLKLLYKEKVYWSDLLSEIEGEGYQGLNPLQHFMFDYLNPTVHNHSQVISFDAGIPHGVPELGQLGVRSFCWLGDYTSSFYYTHFFKNETFKNVFVPMVKFQQPMTGRK